MTDQRATTQPSMTTTERPAMTDQPPTSDHASPTDEPTTTDQAAAAAPTERPMGTRELRDAQASRAPDAGDRRGEGAPPPTATVTATERPPIRATGEDRAGEARQDAPLFDETAGQGLRERWLVIQTEFVDEPRAAVEKADALVAEVLKELTDSFAREREGLEARWSGSGDGSREVSTEDLRQAIQRYRSFFNRLLTL
jgi:hypothetical protein